LVTLCSCAVELKSTQEMELLICSASGAAADQSSDNEHTLCQWILGQLARPLLNAETISMDGSTCYTGSCVNLEGISYLLQPVDPWAPRILPLCPNESGFSDLDSYWTLAKSSLIYADTVSYTFSVINSTSIPKPTSLFHPI
jgi:hypothetical protein